MKTYVVTDINGKAFNFTNKNRAWMLFHELTINDPDDYVTFSDYSKCQHFNVTEIGMTGYYENTTDCGYGCKIVKCGVCDAIFETHSSVYGCSDEWSVIFPVVA